MYLFSFVEAPRKFITAELSIRKLGSSSVPIIIYWTTKLKYFNIKWINTNVYNYTCLVFKT